MSFHREYACATKGCLAIICLMPEQHEKLLSTHETFYCPQGHSNYFPGKTREQKEISDLNRKIDQLGDRVARFRDLWEDALDDREEWKLQAKTCPFGCGYRVLRKSKPENIAATITFHLIEEHGAILPVREEAVS